MTPSKIRQLMRMLTPEENAAYHARQAAAAPPASAQPNVQQPVSKPSGLVPIKRREPQPAQLPSAKVGHGVDQRAQALPTLQPGERLIVVPPPLRWSEPLVTDRGRAYEVLARLAENYPQMLPAEVAAAVAAITDERIRRVWANPDGVPLSHALVRLAKDLKVPELANAVTLWAAYVADKAREDADEIKRAAASGCMSCGCSFVWDGSLRRSDSFGHDLDCTPASRTAARASWESMPTVADLANWQEWYRAEHTAN